MIRHRTPHQVAVLLAAVAVSPAGQAKPTPEQEAFFDVLLALCGTRNDGMSTYPEHPGDDWRDKSLVLTIERCDERELRIALAVGEGYSRAWMLRPVTDGLELKHDHRHVDPGGRHECLVTDPLRRCPHPDLQAWSVTAHRVSKRFRNAIRGRQQREAMQEHAVTLAIPDNSQSLERHRCPST